ncbi:hypothetical protein GQ457_03G024590 [Hibiscus cannabinus]
MVFLPVHQVFTSGGLLDPTKTGEEKDSFDHNPGNFKSFNKTIDEKNIGLLNLTEENLNAYFESLTVNAIIDNEGENHYLKKNMPMSS